MTITEAIDTLINKINNAINSINNIEAYLGTRYSSITDTISYRVRALEEALDNLTANNKDVDAYNYIFKNALRANNMAMPFFIAVDNVDMSHLEDEVTLLHFDFNKPFVKAANKVGILIDGVNNN